MTSSRADGPQREAGRFSAVLLCALVAGVAPLAAAAQSDDDSGTTSGSGSYIIEAPAVQTPTSPDTPGIDAGPVTLEPPKALEPEMPDVEDGTGDDPGGSVQSVEPAEPTSPTGAKNTGIQVDQLGDVNADTAGLLDDASGGLGAGMWRGTSRAVAMAMLRALPVGAPSVAMESLARRLLLTTAAVPDGDGEPGALISLRAEKLAAMGATRRVLRLLEVTPGSESLPRLVRIEAESRLLSGDYARACGLASSSMDRNPTTFWQKLFTLCQVLSGAKAEAELGVSLLREVGDDDPVYFSLIDGLLRDAKPTIGSLPEPTPLQLAMARIAKAQLPEDVLVTERPGALAAIATSPNAAVAIRLEAAERAAATAALSPAELREIYAAVQFDEETLANPLSAAEEAPGPRARALLYQTSVDQSVDAARAESAMMALSLARDVGLYQTTARVFAPMLEAIPARTDLIWFAPEAVRAFVVTERDERSREWYRLMEANALFSGEARDALSLLVPLRHLADDDAIPLSLEAVNNWRSALGDDAAINEKSALFYTLLGALGRPAPDGAWDALPLSVERAPVPLPGAVLWHRLDTAAQDGRVAETVLSALLVLGDGGPARVNSLVVKRVVESLRAIGLDADARAVAVEAALAGGL